MAASATINLEIFKSILANLLNADNEIRTTAETFYESIPLQSKFSFLLQAIGDDTMQPEEGELAAVLLRRLITSDFKEVFLTLTPEIQTEIKNHLLNRVQNTPNHNLRRKICDVAAELARNSIDEEGRNKWPEFPMYLFNAVQSQDPLTREIALLMFAAVPGVCGNLQERFLNDIYQMLCQNLKDTQNRQVRQVAVKATSAFLLANEKETQVQKWFAECVTYLLEYLNEVMDSQDEMPDEVLRHLIDLVEACPQTFRNQIDSLFNICLKGISTPAYLDSCIHLSLEVLVTICEAASPMVKKLAGKHISTLISFVLKMMTNIDDEPKWDFVDDDSADDDGDSTPIIAEAALDRLACALGGKTVLPIIFNTLPHMLNSAEWKERYAGLMAVSAIGEGCHKQMVALLSQIVDGILPFLVDQHTRVRYAGCNALGQMSSDFAPGFQKKFHDKVIPTLLQLLGDASSSRVQAHAGAALVNFFEDCPKTILAPYLDSIVQTLELVLNSKLKELVEKGTKLVLEQVVVTLASLADSAQEKFSNYYDKFMPCLKFIVKNATQPDLRLLRGKTIECVSLIGLAVGKEKFIQDATEVMELLLETQTTSPPVADDDPQLSYMIAAWARICKILGKEFQPYLQYVMEPVLKAAAIKPEIAVLDSDDMKVVENDDDWEFVNLGEKHNFGIRTAGLDEKATACQMLVWYAKELKEGFAHYVEDTVKLMVPMLKFYFHDAVRIAAGEILPYLLESAKAGGDAYVQETWKFILPSFLGALDSEPEIEVLCEHMASFAQCIEILGFGCMENDDIVTLLRILDRNLENHFKNFDQREKRRLDDEFDEVLEENLKKEDDEDVYLLSKISEIVCAMFAVYKKEFIKYFNQILPRYADLLVSSRPWEDRQWALCVFADLIECCGPACIEYQDTFLNPLRESLQDKHADLRQTAAYTIGILAQFGGDSYATYCTDSIPLLIQIIEHPESRNEENERCTENAISAITKMMQFNTQLTNKNNLLQYWLGWLPVWEDEEETKFIYNYLCNQIQEKNPIILGDENCNLPRIVFIFAEAFCREAVELSSEVGQRMIALIREIKHNEPILQNWVEKNLNPMQQNALTTALQ